MINIEPFYKSIKDLRNIYQTKEASVREVTDAFLRRIGDLNYKLNAYIDIYGEDAKFSSIEADKSIKQHKSHKLSGIIIGLKDLIDVKGKTTTAGSKRLRKNIATSNSKITDYFFNQNSIIIGKTNMVEFAFGSVGINTYTPTCRNPWDLERVPGGSSSGSAVAVSAGLCTIAIGTDTGGSVRIPASLCGITGFKPSYGVVSRKGVFDLSWTLDHVGPMARSAKDCLEVMNVISSYKINDNYSKKLISNFSIHNNLDRNKYKIGIPKNYFFENVDHEIKKTILDAANKFDNLGYRVEEIEIPFVDEARSICHGIVSKEVISVHDNYLNHFENYSKSVLNRMLGGLGVTDDEYLAVLRKMSKFNYEMTKAMKSYDFLLTPTVNLKTPLIKDCLNHKNYELNSMLKFTQVFNITGQPSISIPAGLTSDKLPIGLMISGKFLHDNDVLNIAIDWQKETDFHLLRPKVT
tara:strand:- start:46 stop:1440 length:1395 start_codon:yes stop_codon:yes gene_type:complete